VEVCTLWVLSGSRDATVLNMFFYRICTALNVFVQFNVKYFVVIFVKIECLLHDLTL